MSLQEYLSAKREEQLCKFCLNSGGYAFGVASNFFPQEPETCYFVSYFHLDEFGECMERQDYAEARMYCRCISPGEILSVEYLKISSVARC